MIIRGTGEDVQLSALELFRDVDGELVADFGIEVGFADGVARCRKAADHVVEVVSELAAHISVYALLVIARRRNLDIAGRVVGALSEQQIGRQTRLPVGKRRGRAAINGFDRTHGLVHVDEGRLVHERRAVCPINRDAIELHRHKRRIAGAGNAADKDVRSARAARAFDPYARYRRQELARGLGAENINRRMRKGCDRITRFELLDTDAPRMAGDDDDGGVVGGRFGGDRFSWGGVLGVSGAGGQRQGHGGQRDRAHKAAGLRLSHAVSLL